MRKVAHFEEQVTANLPVQRISPTHSGERIFSQLAEFTARTGQNIALTAEKKYLVSLDLLKKQEINRLAQENPSDPEALTQQLEAARNGIMQGIPSDELRERFMQEFDLESMAHINRATAAKQAILDDEYAATIYGNMDLSYQTSLREIPYALDGDPTALANMYGNMNAFGELLNATYADGRYVLSPQARATKFQDAQDGLFGAYVLAGFDKAKNKGQFVKQFKSGQMAVDFPDGAVNVRDAMSYETGMKLDGMLDAHMKQLAAEARAAAAAARTAQRDAFTSELADLELNYTGSEVDFYRMDELEGRIRQSGLDPETQLTIINRINAAGSRLAFGTLEQSMLNGNFEEVKNNGALWERTDPDDRNKLENQAKAIATGDNARLANNLLSDIGDGTISIETGLALAKEYLPEKAYGEFEKQARSPLSDVLNSDSKLKTIAAANGIKINDGDYAEQQAFRNYLYERLTPDGGSLTNLNAYAKEYPAYKNARESGPLRYQDIPTSRVAAYREVLNLEKPEREPQEYIVTMAGVHRLPNSNNDYAEAISIADQHLWPLFNPKTGKCEMPLDELRMIVRDLQELGLPWDAQSVRVEATRRNKGLEVNW